MLRFCRKSLLVRRYMQQSAIHVSLKARTSPNRTDPSIRGQTALLSLYYVLQGEYTHSCIGAARCPRIASSNRNTLGCRARSPSTASLPCFWLTTTPTAPPAPSYLCELPSSRLLWNRVGHVRAWTCMHERGSNVSTALSCYDLVAGTFIWALTSRLSQAQHFKHNLNTSVRSVSVQEI
jgi:hypothetical protein